MKYLSSDSNYSYGDLSKFVKQLVGVKVEREGATFRFYSKDGNSRKVMQTSITDRIENTKWDIHVCEEVYKPMFKDFGYEKIDWNEFKTWVIENC